MPRSFPLPSGFTALLLGLLSVLPLWAEEPAELPPWRGEAVWKEKIFPILQTYCVDCHDEETQKGGVDFASLESLPKARAALRLWWRTHDQLEANQMPPPKKDQPSPEEREALLAWIADNEAFLRSGAVMDPGERRLRRMNRAEYANAVRDLLGLAPGPVKELFPDEGAGGEGFDNNADTLFIPPLLAERYVEGADRVLAAVFERPDLKERLLRVPPAEELPPPAALRETVRPLLRLAFRGKSSEETLEKYARVGDRVLEAGRPWEDAVRLVVKAILCSPDFLLLREENRGDAEVWPVTPRELAVRLSLFLWSSIPDETLLAEAESGKLAEPGALEAQARRMLADPRASALAENFFSQWLQFDKLLTTADPDKRRYGFSEELRQDMFREALEFSNHILRGPGGSFLHVLDCDYVFVNERLAKHYGIPDVEGEQFRQVKLETKNRGGVIGMGAVLTATALPRRTSPVIRGKWVLEQLLGAPPPAPPPNVSQLAEDDRNPRNLTVRQQLERHLRREDCRACHARMDPLGFAMENYDPVGRWRDTLNGRPLDVSGRFPDGRTFNGPAEMKGILLQEKDRYARNLCVKLLSYALGRGIEAADMPTLARMEETLKANDFRAEPLILEVVRSLPFTHRRVRPVPIPPQ